MTTLEKIRQICFFLGKLFTTSYTTNMHRQMFFPTTQYPKFGNIEEFLWPCILYLLRQTLETTYTRNNFLKNTSISLTEVLEDVAS